MTVPADLIESSSHDRGSLKLERDRAIALGCAWLILFSWTGGLVGFCGYFAASLILESSVMPHVEPPKFSYGQPSALISLPLSAVIGIFAGAAFALIPIGWQRASVWSMLGVSFLGAYITYRRWCNSGIGDCTSSIVLYYPIFAFCVLIAGTGFIIAGVRSASRLANSS